MECTKDADGLPEPPQDILAIIGSVVGEEQRKIGRFNRVIAGLTGVGKSTLTNGIRCNVLHP